MSENISSIGATGQHPFAELTKCWNCNTEIDRTDESLVPDGHYGLECPKCNLSLRHHDTYGEGKDKDLGDENNITWR
jgi:hypothetical protein